MRRTAAEDAVRSLPHLYLAGPGSGTPEADGEVAWIRALEAEADLVREEGWRPASPLSSIHIGGPGGRAPRPSTLVQLLEALGLTLDPRGELALEVEPARVDRELLVEWRTAGVTRINLRWESGRELEEAALALARVGWGRHGSREGWGVDLAFGLEGTGPSPLPERIRRLVAAAPPYQLTLEEPAETAVGGDRLAEEYLGLVHILQTLGYEAWELTSFALPGHRPIHARAVWSGASYLGLGAGAHSFDQRVRRWNLDDPAAYITRVRRGRSPLAGSERLAPEEERMEFVWRGLRLAQGIALDLLSHEGRVMKQAWSARGLAHDDAERLRLTPSGWLLLDTLAVDLIRALEVDGWTRPNPAGSALERRTGGKNPGAP